MKPLFIFSHEDTTSIDKSVARHIMICQNRLYYESDTVQPLVEVNDDLHIRNSQNSFWDTIEYELKIDVEPCDIAAVLSGAIGALGQEYSISSLFHQKSFEKHYEMQVDTESMHVVRLGKSSWKIQKALKIKTPYDQTGRRVSILPYSIAEWDKLVEKAALVRGYPSFYKDKYRYILVNKQTGSVFGVSGSGTKFFSKGYPNKYEIEVEYWSNILPLGSRHRFDEKNKEELYAIVKAIQGYLSECNVQSVFPGVKKNEWFRKLYQRQ